MIDALTTIYSLHLPINGISDHEGADKELSPPKKVMGQTKVIKDQTAEKERTEGRQKQSAVNCRHHRQ